MAVRDCTHKCVDELRKTGKLEIANYDFTKQKSNLGGKEEEERQIQRILAKRAFANLSTQDRLMVATSLMGWFSRTELAMMFGYENPESHDAPAEREA